jgi:hypothetical protein
LTHAYRPIFAAAVLAFGLAATPGIQASSLVNWEGLKSSFTYTPIVGESLERIIAKTMPNHDLKPEVLAEAFKALNPLHFSKDVKSVTKLSTALKVPNQNQVFNMVEAQLGLKLQRLKLKNWLMQAHQTQRRQPKECWQVQKPPNPKSILKLKVG